MKKNQLSGKELFHQYYREVWADRWDDLISAFENDGKKIFRKNMWVQSIPTSKEILSNCFEKEEVLVDDRGLKNYYPMDPASVIVARNLNFPKNAKVLDMCAAPGGKSLVLFEALGEDGILVCNEFSRTRKERLRRVVSEYIPSEKISQIDIRGFDGNRYGIYLKDEFDAVLLDAPCSGERHMLNDDSELEKWAPKRTKRLSMNQFSLICSAFMTLKNGGELLYSTCSLSPLENDDVIEKLIERNGQELEVISELEDYGFGEKTKYGHIFLPDKCDFGPLYMCKIRKKSN